VGHFLSRGERSTGQEQVNPIFTNVFVKNFGEQVDEEALRELFAKYGEITSVKVSRDAAGKPVGYGFVNFSKPESAQEVSGEFIFSYSDFDISD
jgi:polyadenylate-binding protein